MGNEIHKQSLFNGNFGQKTWRAISGPDSNICGNPVTVRTSDAKMCADEYIIEAKSSSNFERQRIIYQQRASSMTGNLVNIFSVQQIDVEKQFTSGSKNGLRVRTERIPWRLHKSNNLEIHEALYVLEGAAHGFYQLVQHVREAFMINDEMIGLNSFGRVKVWLNSNFSVNQLQQNKFKVIGLRAMLEEIILVVEFHVKGQSFSQNIRNSLFRAADFTGLIEITNCLLKVSNQQKVDIGKRLTNSVVLNQALRQYAENKTTPFNNARNPQKQGKNTSNNLFSVVEFQRKAIQFVQNQERSEHLNLRSQTGFEQLFMNKPGDSNLYHSPIQNYMGQKSVPEKRILKSIIQYHGSGNYQQHIYEPSLYGSQIRNSQIANQNPGSISNLIQGKRSVIMNFDANNRARDPIIKSEIFTKTPNSIKKLATAHQLRSMGKIGESLKNESIKSNNNVVQQLHGKLHPFPTTVKTQSSNSNYQRKPIFGQKKQQERQNKEIIGRSLTPSAARRNSEGSQQEIPFDKIHNSRQHQARYTTDVKKMGQIKKNFKEDASRLNPPFSNLQHRQEQYKTDSNFHADNRLGRTGSFIQPSRANQRGHRLYAQLTLPTRQNKLPQNITGHRSQSQNPTDSLVSSRHGEGSLGSYELVDTSFNLAAKQSQVQNKGQDQRAWGIQDRQFQRNHIENSIHKADEDPSLMNKPSFQKDLIGYSNESMVISRIGSGSQINSIRMTPYFDNQHKSQQHQVERYAQPTSPRLKEMKQSVKSNTDNALNKSFKAPNLNNADQNTGHMTTSEIFQNENKRKLTYFQQRGTIN